LIFGLVSVSRDFEVGTNVSCEESTVSLRMGLIVYFTLTEFRVEPIMHSFSQYPNNKIIKIWSLSSPTTLGHGPRLRSRNPC